MHFKYKTVAYEYDEKIWEKIPPELVGNTKSMKRAQDLFLSRLLLRGLLIESGEERVEFADLKFNSFYQLEKFPKFTSSISHTAGLSAAIIGNIEQGTFSLGIDVEWLDREVKPEALEYIKNNQDDFSNHTNLENWCMKEAAFKSAYRYPSAPSNLVAKMVWVKNMGFGFIGDQSPLGTLELKHEKTQNGKEYVLAIAKGRLGF